MILNPRQRAVFSKGIALANDVLQKVEYLERLAAAVPEIQQRADEVKSKREFLLHLSQTALDLDRAMGGQ